MKRSTHWLAVSNKDRLPYFSLDSERPGPTIVLVGGVHGDEYTGIELIYRTFEKSGIELSCGRLLGYPCLNPLGAERCERALPELGGDLNRCFPGGERGTRAARYAHVVWQEIVENKPDFVLDIHADSTRSVPYALVDRPVLLGSEARRQMRETLIERARSLGCVVLMEYEERDYQRYGLQHSLAGSLVNFASIPAVTLEVGARGLVDMDAIHVADKGLRGLLSAYGMLKSPEAAGLASTGLWLRSATPPVRNAGMFIPLIGPGMAFEEGEALAYIRQLDGQVVETISATSAGIVVAWRDIAWVKAGAVVGTLGEVVSNGQA
jgi:predicted deacylase